MFLLLNFQIPIIFKYAEKIQRDLEIDSAEFFLHT